MNRVLFGFATGLLVDLVITLTDTYGSTIARCSLEVTLEHRDYTLSELKAAAKKEAFLVLAAMAGNLDVETDQETI